jgi:RHS repeat-associated protein
VRLKYTGHERDQNGNSKGMLDYMHARYESAMVGRFLSVDPARRSGVPVAPQSWNRYSYGLNNPVRFVDSDGRSAEVATAILLGGGNEVVVPAAIAAGVPVVVVGSASALVGRFIGTRKIGGQTIDDRVTDALANLILLFGKESGRGRGSGFIGVSSQELKELLKTASNKLKRRIIRELKNRDQRNRQKQRGGKRQPKKGEGDRSGDKSLFGFISAPSPDLNFLLSIEEALESVRSELCGIGVESCPI